MSNYIFNNISLCPRHLVVYHLVSDCSLSRFPPFFCFIAVFFSSPFFPPLLWETWFSVSDWVCQSDIASLRPTLPLKDIVIGGLSRHMPCWEMVPWIWVTGVRPPTTMPHHPHLPSTERLCVFNTTLLPSKTYNLTRKLQLPKAAAFYGYHFPQFKSQQQKKKASRTFQLAITALLNASLPLAIHLARHHLTAPARNVGTINKLYYSTLTFQWCLFNYFDW